MTKLVVSRRKLLGSIAAGGGGLILSGCDRLGASPAFREVLGSAEHLNMRAQRLAMGDRLAKEFNESDMSPIFRANGTLAIDRPDYRRHLDNGFATWSLIVEGLVMRPLALSLDAIRGLPQREQITRHDCVEGWSAIGKWQGPQLSRILGLANPLPAARFAVFHCADYYGDVPYYESIDLIDAYHPQTILAWRMNGNPLDEAHGAPVRLRVERQLGYKQAKYVMRIELRSSLQGLYDGHGGYWEDAAGYAWYAGI
jgi:DMSO/TMAO reductase YedYZ molybdopterin-dependent catalytic subunit